MKTYEITIKPLSGFGTPLKGDTLFGHICWQLSYDESLLKRGIDELLCDYEDNPFLILSSAFVKINDFYILKRPDMPTDMLFELSGENKKDLIAKRKEFKAKRWMVLNKNKRLKSLKSDNLYLNDNSLLRQLITAQATGRGRKISKHSIKSIVIDYTQPHNTINRLTGTTGEGQFAPFSVDQKIFLKNVELVIFIGLREDLQIGGLLTALYRIGKTGFGKDSSIGLGRFEVTSYEEIDLKSFGSDTPNACYTLAPCVPEKALDQIFFSPFTRFGKHGDVLAKSGKPFKNPVIMADEGAVFVVKDREVFKKPYIGRAVTGISKAETKAVTQGYSLYIPVEVEV